MMVIVVVQLVLLTAAVLVLFAMFGELAGRVPQRPEPTVQPVDEARLGHAVDGLPEAFRPGPGILLVLSTSCGTCAGLAAGAARYFGSGGSARRPLVGILVSCASAESGADFVAAHGLAALPTALDVGGRLSTTELGVRVSPVAVAVDGSATVRSAVAFAEYAALDTWLATAPDRKAGVGR
jgi:hypothetical protein